LAGAWFPAFALATVTALIATPLLARKRASGHRAALATAAGPLLGVGFAVPFAVSHLDAVSAVGLVGAAWLWCAGQLIDRRLLPRVLRRVAVGAAAALVVVAGLRLEVTGVEWADVVVTLGVVWLATSTWRSAETRDGLLLGWAAAIAAGAGVIGGLGGQADIAVLGAAVVGASLGFVAYVVPPVAAARLRTGGALFLGFLTVVLALGAKPSTPAPGSALAPLLLLALPLIDALFAGAARLRGRGTEARTLGLVGRWRALGLSRTATTIGLVAVQIGLSFVALLAARGVLDLALAAAIGGVIVVLSVGPTFAARLDRPRGRWPRWTLGLAALTIGALIVLSAPAAVALLRARSDTTAAESAAEHGLTAARAGDAKAARAAFLQAEQLFTRAHRRLTDPAASLGLPIPVLGPNLRAARDLTNVGIDLAHAGRQLATTADPHQLRIVNATVNLAELERLQPEFEAAARTVASARRRVEAINTAFLIAPIEDTIAKLDRRLGPAVHDSATAAFAAQVLPAVLGGDGPRRYFLAIQNNSESRATGGGVGTWGEISARSGTLDLGEFSRVLALDPASPNEVRTLQAPADYRARYARFHPERSWESINMSPDVPTVGSVEAALLPQSGVGPVDGIVTIDPVGLASVLKLTGPVTVPSWPEPITADNVVAITLHDEYIRFANDYAARDAFLSDVARATWDAFKHRDLGNPATVIKALAQATQAKHLTLWFAKPEEERLAVRAKADGSVPRAPDDLVMLTTQNASGNKIDSYLRRTINYDATLAPDPQGHVVVANAHLVTKLENTAPASGVPPYIIGPTIFAKAGENNTFLTAYSPLRLTTVTLDGQATGLKANRELGRWAYSNYVSLLSNSTRTLDLALTGRLHLTKAGDYELALVRQPLASPDTVAVTLRLPTGWRFADAKDLRVADGGRRATFSGPLNRDRLLRVRIERDHGNGLWGRLQDSR
jgi:Protein of unknown function (DUF4012)